MKETKVQIKRDAKYHSGMVGYLKGINKKTNIGMVYSESGKNPYRVAISLNDLSMINMSKVG